MKRALSILAAALLAGCSSGDTGEHHAVEPDGPQWAPLRVERMGRLNKPRGQHHTLVAGEEPVVIGGHTDGFKPLETLEYYKNGAWHEVPMHYTHDNGFTIPLQDGTIMIGGGCAEAFGIGQSWGVEIYDPTSHSTRALGILDRKRALAAAQVLPDGRVLVAGNWYADDALAIFDPLTGFSTVKEFPSGWERPWILPAQEGEYLIFGPESNHGARTGAQVERLLGDPFQEPLLEKWEVAVNLGAGSMSNCIGGNTWLLTARRKDNGGMGQLIVRDGIFSEMKLKTPLPLFGSDGQPIVWMAPVQVDRSRRRAWMQASERDGRYRYFACIDYDAILDGGSASVDLFRAECPEGRFSKGLTLLTPDGRLILAGGVAQDEKKLELTEDNFVTMADVWVFHPDPAEESRFPWGWVAVGLVLLGGCPAILNRLVRKHRPAGDDIVEDSGTEASLRTDLMTQMTSLIEEEQLYLRKNLRITDVAAELATNKTYVSAILNNLSGERFTSLITRCRVEHAQRLMHEHPDMLLDHVADESGFSSRTTFFRSFKALTGMTPQEWKKNAGGS